MQGILGILVFCGIAWVVSEKRSTINWRVLFGGLLMQFGLAIILIKFPPIAAKIALLNNVVQALDQATMAGTSFIFGYLGGGQLPFENITGNPGSTFILAFRALPLVMVVSALTSLLFYWKVLPYIVRGFAFILRKSLGIGGAEGLGSAANIFVGMVEAPLFIKPYMNRLNRSELFVIMTAGMATIAGTMMVIYAFTIAPLFEGEYALETAGPGALGHLLIASLLSAPASIVIARLMIPETDTMQRTDGQISDPHPAKNSMDAVTHGTMEGLKLWLNIIAMLIVLVALVALVNMFLGWLHNMVGADTESEWSLQAILGWIMQIFVWLMGVPWSEAGTAGEWMGTKIILNEFLAYLDMVPYVTGEVANVQTQIQTLRDAGEAIPMALSMRLEALERTSLIMSYAICGFANFGSLGIMLGGLGTMAPERRGEIAGLGMKSILAGNLATMLTGSVVGLIYYWF